MKNLIFIIFLFLVISCSTNKKLILYKLIAEEFFRIDYDLYIEHLKKTVALNKEKLFSDRLFFTQMDSITKYTCKCSKRGFERLTPKDTIIAYIYLSKRDTIIDNHSYHKINFISDSLKIKTQQYYPNFIRLSNDTVFNAYLSEDSRHPSAVEQLKENIFLIFENHNNKRWKTSNSFKFMDSVKIVKQLNIDNILINHFQGSHFQNTISHGEEFVRDMFVSKNFGILSFRYFDGYSDFDCFQVPYLQKW